MPEKHTERSNLRKKGWEYLIWAMNYFCGIPNQQKALFPVNTIVLYSTFSESLEKWSGWESLEHCLKELTTKLWHWLWNYYMNRIIRSYYSSMNWRSAGKSYLLISLFFHSWGIAVIVVSDQNYVKRMETWAVNKTLIFLTFCQS